MGLMFNLTNSKNGDKRTGTLESFPLGGTGVWLRLLLGELGFREVLEEGVW